MPRSPRSSVIDPPDTERYETEQTGHASGRPTMEEVAREAYLIYCAHGCEDGHDQEHWYEAERRLAEGSR